MRNVPAEIDFGLDDPAVFHAVQLGVAEALAVGHAFINDEGQVTVFRAVDEIHLGEGRAVGPASLEECLTAQRIVHRAGEAVGLADDSLDGRAILVGKGPEGAPCGFKGTGHCGQPR